MYCDILKTPSNLQVVRLTPPYHLRFYSPTPELQIVILAKAGQKTNYRSEEEEDIETLVNQVVREYDLNPDATIWIQDDSHYSQTFVDVKYSLVRFDWYNRQATNPHRRKIHESWYLSWLETMELG